MGFPRQEYWREEPCPPPGTFPTQGLTCVSFVAGEFFTAEPLELPRWEAYFGEMDFQCKTTRLLGDAGP